jgi:hypothetical protein
MFVIARHSVDVVDRGSVGDLAPRMHKYREDIRCGCPRVFVGDDREATMSMTACIISREIPPSLHSRVHFVGKVVRPNLRSGQKRARETPLACWSSPIYSRLCLPIIKQNKK